MAILINKTKRNNFLIVSKIFLQDKNLSLAERGLLATMHSLQDNWEFSIRGMSKILPDGETKIKTALGGLIEKGYVSKGQVKTPDGKFGKNLIEINEKPVCVNPVTENPVSVNPVAEKQEQYNIKKYKNKINNTNLSINLDTAQKDGEIEIAAYRKLVAKNIDLDGLLEMAGSHNEKEVGMVNEIYELVCDMVCYSRRSVEIKGVQYPWGTVKEQFLKLRYYHIAGILNRIVDAELEIKNMNAYLISTLYTASLVGTLEEQASIHDDYLKHLRGKPY